MRAINKTQSKIFLSIIAAIPDGQTSVTIGAKQNALFLPLHVTKLDIRITLQNTPAAYYCLTVYDHSTTTIDRQIDFAVIDKRTPDYPVIEQLIIIPVYYREDPKLITQELVMADKSGTVQAIARKEQGECAKIANCWLSDLQKQHSIEQAVVPDVLVWMINKKHS